MSEFHDEYSESLDAEFRKLEDALLSDKVGLLAPSEPIRLPPAGSSGSSPSATCSREWSARGASSAGPGSRR